GGGGVEMVEVFRDGEGGVEMLEVLRDGGSSVEMVEGRPQRSSASAFRNSTVKALDKSNTAVFGTGVNSTTSFCGSAASPTQPKSIDYGPPQCFGQMPVVLSIRQLLPERRWLKREHTSMLGLELSIMAGHNWHLSAQDKIELEHFLQKRKRLSASPSRPVAPSLSKVLDPAVQPALRHFTKTQSTRPVMIYSRFHWITPPPRQCIDLFFDEKYSIEPSWECKFDHIEVRDGPFGFSPIIGRYCGQQSPQYIRSSGRYLWIKFVADGELEAIGFSATYSFTAADIIIVSECDHIVEAEHNDEYRVCKACLAIQWVGLRVPGLPFTEKLSDVQSFLVMRSSCSLSLPSVKTQHECSTLMNPVSLNTRKATTTPMKRVVSDADQDRINSDDVCVVAAGQPGKQAKCSRVQADRVSRESLDMLSGDGVCEQRVVTHHSVPMSGADPDFKDMGVPKPLPFCEFEMGGPEGIIESQQVTREGKASPAEAVDCRWYVRAPPSSKIYLRFLDYEMQNSNECKRNFVAVYDGSSSVENLKSKFCSTVANDVMLSTAIGVVRMWADEGSRHSHFRILFTTFRQRKPCTHTHTH
ncbi:hypothetical protein P4O66_004793, partial [Electrophorus voltai]